MAWGCDRCGRVVEANPGECPNCGHHILRQVVSEHLPERDGDGPLSVNPDELARLPSSAGPTDATAGTDADGSSAAADSAEGRQGALARFLGWLP